MRTSISSQTWGYNVYLVCGLNTDYNVDIWTEYRLGMWIEYRLYVDRIQTRNVDWIQTAQCRYVDGIQTRNVDWIQTGCGRWSTYILSMWIEYRLVVVDRVQTEHVQSFYSRWIWLMMCQLDTLF